MENVHSVYMEQVVHVGFLENVNGGHSDGWKTAKLQVVRREVAANTRSRKMLQADKC